MFDIVSLLLVFVLVLLVFAMALLIPLMLVDMLNLQEELKMWIKRKFFK